MKTLTNYLEIVISTDAVARLGFSWWRGLRSKHFVLDIMLGICTSQGKGWNKQASQLNFFSTHILTYQTHFSHYFAPGVISSLPLFLIHQAF